jgi:F-type H+-transporting ATPase subunit alpha
MADATLLSKINSWSESVKPVSVGTITKIGDGVAHLSGLNNAMMSELIEFPGGTFGLALSLHTESVGVVLLGEYSHLKEGMTATATGKILSIPVGPNFLGRVVNPLGEALDGQANPEGAAIYPIENIAPGVITRPYHLLPGTSTAPMP